jgi:hypothetical protein
MKVFQMFDAEPNGCVMFVTKFCLILSAQF